MQLDGEAEAIDKDPRNDNRFVVAMRTMIPGSTSGRGIFIDDIVLGGTTTRFTLAGSPQLLSHPIRFTESGRTIVFATTAEGGRYKIQHHLPPARDWSEVGRRWTDLAPPNGSVGLPAYAAHPSSRGTFAVFGTTANRLDRIFVSRDGGQTHQESSFLLQATFEFLGSR